MNFLNLEQLPFVGMSYQFHGEKQGAGDHPPDEGEGDGIGDNNQKMLLRGVLP